MTARRQRASAPLRRLVGTGVVWALGSGCVYYNGVYNAEAFARKGDARLRRDLEAEATAEFQQSAARAESVLVRHPTSKWRTRALYLAGRGAALGGNCDGAVPRLREFLSLADVPPGDRDRARVALAACDLRATELVTARARVDSVLAAPHATLRQEDLRQARIWGARAALTQGALDAVPVYLGDLQSDVLPWELIGASVGARQFARAESLIVQRAQRGEYREDVVRAVREMGMADDFAGAERIVESYDRVRVREVSRAQLHYTLGEQLLRAGRDTVARRHFAQARELAPNDTIISRESLVRLTFVDARRTRSLRQFDSVLARVDSAGWRTVYGRRAAEQMLLLRLLNQQTDPSGAAAFLAAEVVRDSLRAPWLAASLFTSLARSSENAPVAPHAWYAASTLEPDSAADWQRLITSRYGFSSVAARLRGEDPASRPDFVSTPELLRFTWTEAVRKWSDSLRVLRAAAQRAPRQP